MNQLFLTELFNFGYAGFCVNQSRKRRLLVPRSGRSCGLSKPMPVISMYSVSHTEQKYLTLVKSVLLYTRRTRCFAMSWQHEQKSALDESNFIPHGENDRGLSISSCARDFNSMISVCSELLEVVNSATLFVKSAVLNFNSAFSSVRDFCRFINSKKLFMLKTIAFNISNIFYYRIEGFAQ